MRAHSRRATWSDASILRPPHEAGRAPAVEALLDYEDSARRATSAEAPASPAGSPVAPGTALRRSDKPVRIKHVSVIEPNYNIQTVVDSLKLQSRPVWERSPHFYVTREVSAGMDRLDRVSDSMACLLRLCDGRHRIAEIVPRLSATLHDVKAPLREYVCLRLLSGAQAEQFIDIYRTASSTQNKRAHTGPHHDYSTAQTQ